MICCPNAEKFLNEYKLEGLGAEGRALPCVLYNNSFSLFNLSNLLLINEFAVELCSLKVLLFSKESYDEYLLKLLLL